MTLLEAHRLSVIPPGGSEPVVRDVSLAVQSGEWVAIVGSNGSGKTTLLHALAGIWPASSGELRFRGRPHGPDQPAADRAGIATILQEPASQLLQRTVGEELSFTAHNLGNAPERVADRVSEVARRFDLDRELDLDPANLSAGRQQLVLLASALIAKPTLLCADEPTAHLDAESRERVMNALREEMERGTAIVWVTQEMAECSAATRRLQLDRPSGAESAEPDVRDADPGSRTRSPTLIEVTLSPQASDRGPRIRIESASRLEIRSGVTALHGPNGAGKSLLAEALAGVEPHDQAAIAWRIPAEPKPLLTLQYPELQVFEEQVADEITFASISRGVSRDEAEERAAISLRQLGFEPIEFLARRTWPLAAGEKRLVEVVAALIAPASLLVLDEPTAGLDPVRRSVLARLIVARAERTPIVIATQDHAFSRDVGAAIWRLGDASP
jgi:energy-coupling factor transport system ATP-binding protein